MLSTSGVWVFWQQRVGHALLLLSWQPEGAGGLVHVWIPLPGRGGGVCIYPGTAEGVVQGATQKPQEGPVRAALMP